MKRIGNEIYVQRGETFSLDFAVTDKAGRPLVLLKNWKNPHMVITVATSLYPQADTSREVYWLDLNKRYVEQNDGTLSLVTFKRFMSTEIFRLAEFDAMEAVETYDKMVFNRNSDFDVTNFLFFVDVNGDGKYEYKYLDDYTLDGEGQVIAQTWVSYDFRVVKYFDTKNWTAQGYFYDIKILSGESVQEYFADILDREQIEYKTLDEWNVEDWETYLSMVEDKTVHDEVRALYDEGAPLMPIADTKMVILEPTAIHVSTNIQGGIR